MSNFNYFNKNWFYIFLCIVFISCSESSDPILPDDNGDDYDLILVATDSIYSVNERTVDLDSVVTVKIIDSEETYIISANSEDGIEREYTITNLYEGTIMEVCGVNNIMIFKEGDFPLVVNQIAMHYYYYIGNVYVVNYEVITEDDNTILVVYQTEGRWSENSKYKIYIGKSDELTEEEINSFVDKVINESILIHKCL